MSLIYGPSAIAFSNISPDYYYVGVGPYIRIYKNDVLIFEHFIFPITTRIVGIAECDKYVITYASNILKILTFSSDFSSYTILMSEEFEDYVLAASIDEIQNPEGKISLTVILHHGQLCRVSEKISVSQPKVWKIVTSAYIVNRNMIISGDSFGCISILQTDSGTEINKETEYGTVFEIDFNRNTQQILAAYEFKACGLFQFDGKKIISIWIMQNHPSRVWGCRFLSIGPVSYGEDGCIHLFKQIEGDDKSDSNKIQNIVFHLHRTKNITALASRGNEVITGGQNSLLRHLTLFDNQPEIIPYCLTTPNPEEPKSKTDKRKDPLTPFSLAIVQNGEVIVGTLGGSIYSLPSRREMLTGEEYDGWYLMQSYQNIVFGASRSHHHYLLQVKQKEDGSYDYITNIFQFPSNCAAQSLAISPKNLVASYSDNNIRIYDFDGNEKGCFSFSEYIKKPPIAMCIHHSRPIVCIGSHSSRVVVLCFTDDFSSIDSTFLIQSASSDGFKGIIFCNDTIYTAGRTDGTVSIIGEMNGEWRLKSSWRIAAQCKAAAGIDAIKLSDFNGSERPIVSVVTKEGIVFWDIETQTMVSQHPLIGVYEKLNIKFTSIETYSLAWIDHLNVLIQSNIHSIPAFSIGTSFHGLRGLCMTKLSNQNGDLIATGGCDRDVKLWRVIDGNLKCVESLQAVDSGTHAVCFNVNDSLLFAGGSKEFLYVWKLAENDQLFRLNIFEVGDNRKNYKLRVISMSLASRKRLFIGMSDASVRVFDYSLEENDLKFIKKFSLKGVPVSSNCVDFGDKEIVSFATSTGDVYWFLIDKSNDEIEECTQRLMNCGIHCIRSFVFNDAFYVVTAGDDGAVKIWIREKSDEPVFAMRECLSIEKGHTGGTKALAIDLFEDKIKILSFSYDQKAIIYIVDLNSFEIISSKHFCVSVTDGISCEFVKGGFVVFGFAIQYFNESD